MFSNVAGAGWETLSLESEQRRSWKDSELLISAILRQRGCQGPLVLYEKESLLNSLPNDIILNKTQLLCHTFRQECDSRCKAKFVKLIRLIKLSSSVHSLVRYTIYFNIQ